MARQVQDQWAVGGPRDPVGNKPERGGQLFGLLATEADNWAAFALDAEGCVSRWSAGAERLLGFGPQDIEGKHFSILFIPEDLEHGRPAEELMRAARLGRWEGECFAVRKEGSVFWAKAVSVPLRDQAGVLCGFARVMQDLTQSKANEAALQLCLEIWDHLPEGLLVFRPENGPGGRSLRILAANTAVLQVMREGGPSLEELSGAKWADVAEAFHPLPNEDISNSVWSVIASGKARNLGQIRRRGKDLQEAVFALKAFPLSQRCAGLLFENITESGRIEDAGRTAKAKYQDFL